MESVVVEINQKKYYQSNDGQSGSGTAIGKVKEAGEAEPGIMVVRNCTPRPMTTASLLSTLSSGGQSPYVQQEDVTIQPDFPTRAPSAPPLPEEIGDQEEETTSDNTTPITQPGTATAAIEEPQEFDWLFEYGLEMDTSILNSPERLDGAALLYGPAVLKGYSIMLGCVGGQGESGGERAIATVVPGSGPDAEVWGVLYRIPHRLRKGMKDEPSLLDTVHAAGLPQSLFRPVQAVVHETYRNRQIECVMYIATDTVHHRLKPLSTEQGGGDIVFVQRLTTIARKLGLPDRYLNTYSARAALMEAERSSERLAAMVRTEQNTEPLSAITGRMPMVTSTALPMKEEVPSASPWMIVFAVYLALKLLLVLTFAVLQGMGFAENIFTSNFTLLGVPWLVLMYGLLGGCVSSIISLGRTRVVNPPVFVVITWFTRPYVGAALALLSYLFLTSGFFVFDKSIRQYTALFLLVGALTGLCEGWIFTRQK